MPRNPIYFHVAPKYSGGSPAQVREFTAVRVAHQERDGWERAKSGVYGTEEAQKAEREGLDRIVYTTHERRSFVQVIDLLTGNVFDVPSKSWSGHHWYSREDYMKFFMYNDPELVVVRTDTIHHV